MSLEILVESDQGIVRASPPKKLLANVGSTVILIAYDPGNNATYMESITSFVTATQESRANATCYSLLSKLKKDYSDLSHLLLFLAGDLYIEGADQEEHHLYRAEIVDYFLKEGVKRSNIKTRWSASSSLTDLRFDPSKGELTIR